LPQSLKIISSESRGLVGWKRRKPSDQATITGSRLGRGQLDSLQR
jgi:hypothetical protein